MGKTVIEAHMEELLKAQQGELDAVLMYKKLAEKVKDEKDAQAFRRLSSDEQRHADVFAAMTKKSLTPNKTLSVFVPKAYAVLGKKLLYPVIAKFEYDAEKTYAPLCALFPEVQAVASDEKHHGDAIKALLKN